MSTQTQNGCFRSFPMPSNVELNDIKGFLGKVKCTKSFRDYSKSDATFEIIKTFCDKDKVFMDNSVIRFETSEDYLNFTEKFALGVFLFRLTGDKEHQNVWIKSHGVYTLKFVELEKYQVYHMIDIQIPKMMNE